MLQNENSLANIGLDTTEIEPLKVPQRWTNLGKVVCGWWWWREGLNDRFSVHNFIHHTSLDTTMACAILKSQRKQKLGRRFKLNIFNCFRRHMPLYGHEQGTLRKSRTPQTLIYPRIKYL